MNDLKSQSNIANENIEQKERRRSDVEVEGGLTPNSTKPAKKNDVLHEIINESDGHELTTVKVRMKTPSKLLMGKS